MLNKNLFSLFILCLSATVSCSQKTTVVEENSQENTTEKKEVKKQKPHQYGGWYCPDNLHGFPAIDIKDWKNVPVVNGRLATKEETQNGTSLIFVDSEAYPDAKPIDMEMPKLARFYNYSSNKDELIIVIQAIAIANDSIVGFRYLNGGNGSARLNEVTFLSKPEIDNISSSHFVTIDIDINATQEEIWKVLTEPEYYKTLQGVFDKENLILTDYNKTPVVNFKYPNAGKSTSEYANILFGNYYIQMDFEQDDYQYVEKFFVSENHETHISEFIVVCGPYEDDYESQKNILTTWTQKVKALSEKL